jgi:hypothetical protein
VCFVSFFGMLRALGDRRVLPPAYEDCILEINEKRGKGYPLSLSGPAGRQTATLHISPASAALRASLLRLKSFATDEQFLRELGHALFTALFPPRLLSAWKRNKQKIDRDTHLRLKLVIEPPEVAALPWELMCDEDGFPLATTTPIVRYQAHPDPPQPLNVRPPLRVLVSLANPRDQAPLSSLREKERITKALAPLIERGLVHLTISEQSSGIGLLNDLRRGVHVWHFIGHGVFNAFSANGSLAFENESGDTDLIDAKRLRILLEPTSVRLAILNACETGRFSLDPLLGIAPALVRAGIPAVVAMQFAFPDTSAIEFASMFYSALADGYPVDACVSEGRKAVIAKMGLSQPDWAIPVLYMRSLDGHLFVQGEIGDGPAAQPGARALSQRPDPLNVRYLDSASLRRVVATLAQATSTTLGGVAIRGRLQVNLPEDGMAQRKLLAEARRELARRQGCR